MRNTPLHLQTCKIKAPGKSEKPNPLHTPNFVLSSLKEKEKSFTQLLSNTQEREIDRLKANLLVAWRYLRRITDKKDDIYGWMQTDVQKEKSALGIQGRTPHFSGILYGCAKQINKKTPENCKTHLHRKRSFKWAAWRTEKRQKNLKNTPATFCQNIYCLISFSLVAQTKADTQHSYFSP